MIVNLHQFPIMPAIVSGTNLTLLVFPERAADAPSELVESIAWILVVG